MKVEEHKKKCRLCSDSYFCEEAMRLVDDEVMITFHATYPDDDRFNEIYAGVD